MVSEKIVLRDGFDLPETAMPATLEVFARGEYEDLGKGRRYPTVVLCPGGGYGGVADREAEPVALALLAKGINCFILRYSCAPARYPTQLLETAAAFAHVRRNSARYSVDEDRVSVMGFSAGGHLAGSYATHWHEDELFAPLGTKSEERRPNGAILCYGVLSLGEKTHEGTLHNLLGESPDPELRKKLSFEHAVTAHTPPAFLWHTCTDIGVPVENSLYAAEALSGAGIPFEMHIYPEGPHGLSIANGLAFADPSWAPPKYISKWIDHCTDWVNRL